MPTTSAPMTASLPPPRPASAVSVEEVLAGRRSVRNFPHCRPAFTGGPKQHEFGPHRLRRPAARSGRRRALADALAVVVIAAVFRRTSVKYGERGERYVHIEAGHAAENACLQAVAVGLGTTIVGAFSDAEVKRLPGLSEEEPLLLIPVGKPG
jgi:Nitroreductase family